MTFKKLHALYTPQDRERICLAEAEHPECGPYLCTLTKGHENGNDPRLRDHSAACRKHHCCVVSWESVGDGVAT